MNKVTSKNTWKTITNKEKETLNCFLQDDNEDHKP